MRLSFRSALSISFFLPFSQLRLILDRIELEEFQLHLIAAKMKSIRTVAICFEMRDRSNLFQINSKECMECDVFQSSHAYLLHTHDKNIFQNKAKIRNIPQNELRHRFVCSHPFLLLHRLSSLLCIHFHLVKIKRAFLSFRIVAERAHSIKIYSYTNAIDGVFGIRLRLIGIIGSQFVLPQTKVCAPESANDGDHFIPFVE